MHPKVFYAIELGRRIHDNWHWHMQGCQRLPMVVLIWELTARVLALLSQWELDMSSWWSLLTVWRHSWSYPNWDSDFWPDPGDVVHFDIIFPLIKKLRGWSQKVTLKKWKVTLVVSSMKLLMSVLRKVVFNIPCPEQIWRITMAHSSLIACSSGGGKAYCPPSPVMKPPINTS